MADDKVNKGIVAGGIVTATTGAAGSVLYVFGFTASGVLKGSIAAGIQAGIGNVAGGSAFAMAQSFAATTALGTAAPLVMVGVGVAAAGYGVYRLSQSKEIEK